LTHGVVLEGLVAGGRDLVGACASFSVAEHAGQDRGVLIRRRALGEVLDLVVGVVELAVGRIRIDELVQAIVLIARIKPGVTFFYGGQILDARDEARGCSAVNEVLNRRGLRRQGVVLPRKSILGTRGC
jgi:hypothetical protein